jgi:hypothetical protein
MRFVLILLLAAIVAVGAFVAWPLFDLYRLAEAVRGRDEAAFRARVDLDAVRTSLAEQFIAQASSGGIRGIGVAVDPAGQAIVTNLIAARLESVITPEVVFELLRRGRLDAPTAGAGEGGGSGGGASSFTLPADPLSRFKGLGYALPPSLRVTVGEGDDPAEWLTLAMTFRLDRLGWALTEVALPERVFRRLGRELRMELRSG